jgi:hypothetical protein
LDITTIDLWPGFPFVPTGSIVRREDFGLLWNLRGLKGTAVEVGTDRGAFASKLLSCWEGQKLVCVDPWQDNLEGYHSDPPAHRPREPDYQEALKVLNPYGSRVEVLRMPSEEAVGRFRSESLDAVHLDANHWTLQQDIALWGSRLKSGGCLCGHDFTGDWEKQTRPPLLRLLEQWKRPIFYLLGDAGSWFTFRP